MQAQSDSVVSSTSQQNNVTSAKPPSSAALLLETIQISYAPAGLKPQAGAKQLSAGSSTAPSGGIEVITITGQRIGGGRVSIGFSCASVMCGSIQDSMSSWLQDQLARYSRDYIEPDEVTDRVCSTIRDMSPGYCAANYSSIARLRNFPNTWQFPATTNGCGSGSVEGLVFAVLRSEYSWNNNINEPILGHNFLSACNNHDICYNNQQGKDSCDAVFRRAMESVCGSNSRCLVASDLYHAAVKSDRSVSAYMRAGQAATCSRIKQSYAANYCPAT